MIALLDYGAGNLTSVRKALATVGADVCVPAQASELTGARAIIVPGVGHFGATRALGPEWVDAVLAAIGEGRPLLGICLGMHWLYESSDEAPDLRALGALSGRVVRMANHDATPIKLAPLTRFSIVALSILIVVFGVWPKPILEQLKEGPRPRLTEEAGHLAKK